MAKWIVNPATINNSLQGTIDYTDTESRWQVKQDEKPFLEEVQREKDNQKKNSHLRKFATIPDIVAIEILEKYGLDVHSTQFMSDIDGLKKLKQIILQDYKHLVVNS